MVLMQLWAGIFFTANKVFMTMTEYSIAKKSYQSINYRMWSWVCYLIGVPGWCIIFMKEDNFIAFSTLIAGVPSIIIGIIDAMIKKIKRPAWLNYFAIIMIILGCVMSFYKLNGFHKITQLYESITAIGYLVGTYLLAHRKNSGYLWWLSTHLSTLLLMVEIDKNMLAVQQGITIVLVWYAYKFSKQAIKNI